MKLEPGLNLNWAWNDKKLTIMAQMENDWQLEFPHSEQYVNILIYFKISEHEMVFQ